MHLQVLQLLQYFHLQRQRYYIQTSLVQYHLKQLVFVFHSKSFLILCRYKPNRCYTLYHHHKLLQLLLSFHLQRQKLYIQSSHLQHHQKQLVLSQSKSFLILCKYRLNHYNFLFPYFHMLQLQLCFHLQRLRHSVQSSQIHYRQKQLVLSHSKSFLIFYRYRLNRCHLLCHRL